MVKDNIDIFYDHYNTKEQWNKINVSQEIKTIFNYDKKKIEANLYNIFQRKIPARYIDQKGANPFWEFSV